MGMFGAIGRARTAFNAADPDTGVSSADRFAAAMAALGGDENAYANFAKLQAAGRAAAARDQFGKKLGGMIGAQYQNGPDPTVSVPQVGGGMPDDVNMGGFMPSIQKPAGGPLDPGMSVPPTPGSEPWRYQPPVKVSDGLNANSPELPGLLMEAQNAGYNMDDLLKVFQMQQPKVHYDRGFGYDESTGKAAGGFHPELDKGQEPMFDQYGRITSVRNLGGAVQSAAEMAGAVKGAEAAAQAPYQPVQTTDHYGRPTTINAARLAAGANGQGAPFVGQSPAQTAADTAVATAGANAAIGLPQSQADAEQAVQLIEAIKANPALRDRTGWKSILPATPGTPGASFDAADDQLRGKLFMQAYAGLKGGGQITEVEGKKATQAIARLSRSQSPEDYTAALNDLESVIQSGLNRAQQQPGRLQPNAAGGQGAPARPGRAAIEAEMRRRGLIR